MTALINNRYFGQTTQQSPYLKVVSDVRNKARPELLTQAWCKFHEILCHFNLVPESKKGNQFKSLHLCEGKVYVSFQTDQHHH